MDKICIICLEEDNQYTNMFSLNNEELNIRQTISTHFQFEVSHFLFIINFRGIMKNIFQLKSSYKVVCTKCWTIVENFHEFHQKILQLHTNNIESTFTIKTEIENDIKCDNISSPNHTDMLDTLNCVEVFIEEKSYNFEDSFKYDCESDNDQLESDTFCKTDDLNDPVLKKRKSVSKKISTVKTENQFTCHHCSKLFPKKSLLQKHIISLHSEKKYKCKQCDKNYATIAILNQHVRKSHEMINSIICDVCAKVFSNKNNCEEHKRYVHNADNLPPVQCEECGQWMKNKMNLKKHVQRSHNKDNAVYTCDICGKVSKNKNALSSHKRKVHILERKYKCNFCEKAFKEETLLKEHIASHTGDRLYSCEFCSLTCNSSANMLTHRKKIHPIEWEEYRLRKTNIPQKIK